MSSDELRVVVWNVEHGSAAYARTPNDRSIVLDAGSSLQFSPARWLKEQYGVEQAHWFIVSHPHADHISDVVNVDELLKPCVFSRNKSTPESLVYPNGRPQNDPLKRYRDFCERYCHPLSADSPYQATPESNWGGVRVTEFTPSGDYSTLNNYSMATYLLYGNLEILFPGDLETGGWEELMKDSKFRSLATPSSTNSNETRILVAAHHGHKQGVHVPFLELYQPHLTIMSDKWGDENTDYSTYRAYSQGFSVYDCATKRYETKKILTTKTNDYVLIVSKGGTVSVSV
jgi:beta-lactamase superfamily II metal-dependent hydrolase